MNNHTPYLIEYFKVPALVSNARLGKWETAFVFVNGHLLDRTEQMQYLIDHYTIAKKDYVPEEGLMLEYNGEDDVLLIISNQLPYQVFSLYADKFLELCADATHDSCEKWILFELQTHMSSYRQIYGFIGELNDYIDNLKLAANSWKNYENGYEYE